MFHFHWFRVDLTNISSLIGITYVSYVEIPVFSEGSFNTHPVIVYQPTILQRQNKWIYVRPDYLEKY